MGEAIMVLETQNRYVAKAIAKFRVIIPYEGYDIAVDQDEVVVYELDSNNQLYRFGQSGGLAIKSCIDYIDSRNRNHS
jgi:hypothetical protein